MDMDYTRYAEMAYRQINKWGKWFPIEMASAGTFDPITDAFTQTITQEDLRGLFLDFRERDIDGTVVQVGDKRILVSASPNQILLDESHKIKILMEFLEDASGEPILDADGKIIYGADARSMSPISIVPLEPGGDPILYKIHARG